MALNTLTYVFMSYGIPIMYYGTEAKLSGGSDPLNREPFDPFNGQPNFNSKSTDEVMRKYIKSLNHVRSSQHTYNFEPDFRLHENGVLVFTKSDNTLVALTNTPENIYLAFFLTNHPFKSGDKLCNAFSEWDCIEVDKDKRLKITLVEGYPKLYVKTENISPPDEDHL